MEKKKRFKKTAAFTPQEMTDTTQPLIIEDQNSPNVANDIIVGESSHDNGTDTEQLQPTVQWPSTSQPANEQSLLTPEPHGAGMHSSTILGQVHQSQNQQQNSSTYQVQQNQPFLQFSQVTMPPWLAQLPGYYLPGAILPAPFQQFPPVGTTEVGWQDPGISYAGSIRSQQQIPSFNYLVGCPYPGFPGPWGSSFGFSQLQLLPSCTSTSAGLCSYFPTPLPPVPGYSSTSAPSGQRGIIHPSVKLSSKHQQLWEAQSSENVQLWNVVGQLQSELADCKCRLAKLESDILDLEPVTKLTTTCGGGASLRGQTSKKGRPKKLVNSSNELISDPSRHRVFCQKPAAGYGHCENKELHKPVHNEVSVQQKDDGNGKTYNTMNYSGIIGFSDSYGAVYTAETNPSFPGAKSNEATLKGSSKLRTEHVKDGVNTGVSPGLTISSHLGDRIGTVCSSRNCAGMSSEENFLWPSNITSEGCGRDLIGVMGFNAFNAMDQGRQAIEGWNFGNGVDGLVGIQSVAEESVKGEDQEMEDERSSGAEDIH